jgi:hypothetical protein
MRNSTDDLICHYLSAPRREMIRTNGPFCLGFFAMTLFDEACQNAISTIWTIMY